MDERTESGREFQTLGAAARKEREPKVRLVRGTCRRLEEKDVNAMLRFMLVAGEAAVFLKHT